MKHITLFLGIFLLLLAGCQQDDLVPSRDQDKSLKSVRATTSSVVKGCDIGSETHYIRAIDVR